MTALEPIVIIGAARSGTKILRDSLTAAAATGRVPYDVGYVWRHGNESSPHDMLDHHDLTPPTRRFVRRFLAKYADPDGRFIEKTVGNTLRVGFVAEILPEAKFVYLERDGVDAAVSTQREWFAPTDWRYVAEKSRHFPTRLVPSYGAKFLRAQTLDRWRGDGRVGTWGPRYPGIDDDLARDGLLRVCARQWRASVTSAEEQLAGVEQPVVSVRFEDLIEEPAETLTRLLLQLGLTVDSGRVQGAAQMIDPAAAKPARPSLTEDDRAALTEELGSTLKARGYDQP